MKGIAARNKNKKKAIHAEPGTKYLVEDGMLSMMNLMEVQHRLDSAGLCIMYESVITLSDGLSNDAL